MSGCCSWRCAAVVAVLLAVALYFAAQETPVEFNARRSINCTPERVFEFLKDPSNVKKLHPFIAAAQTAEFQKLGDGVEYKKTIITEMLPLFYGYSYTVVCPLHWTSYDKNLTIDYSSNPSFLFHGGGRYVVQPGAAGENTTEVVETTVYCTVWLAHSIAETQLSYAHATQLDALKKVLE